MARGGVRRHELGQMPTLLLLHDGRRQTGRHSLRPLSGSHERRDKCREREPEQMVGPLPLASGESGAVANSR